MNNNKLIIAAAGSGKTTLLVKEGLNATKGNILITTYTEANGVEISKKIIEKNKYIPGHLKVQTWFSFLLEHGVRPYQGYLFENDIKGMSFVNNQSARGKKESEPEKHYFDGQHKIYSDKISKFLIKCNEKSGGKIIDRLYRIYPNICIDEIQDLSGYDLDFLKLIFNSNINALLVGDPRQGTYSTSNVAKNKKYKKSSIVYFFEDTSIKINKDESSLIINYRSIPAICDLSNCLFPQYLKTKSGNTEKTSHDGIFLVRPRNVDSYLSEYEPMQLRDRKNKVIENSQPVMNFGESKGLTFDRVLIYTTEPIKKWLKEHNNNLAPVSRSKLYVAITRARFSVAFVYDYKDDEIIDGMVKYFPIDSTDPNK